MYGEHDNFGVGGQWSVTKRGGQLVQVGHHWLVWAVCGAPARIYGQDCMDSNRRSASVDYRKLAGMPGKAKSVRLEKSARSKSSSKKEELEQELVSLDQVLAKEQEEG